MQYTANFWRRLILQSGLLAIALATAINCASAAAPVSDSAIQLPTTSEATALPVLPASEPAKVTDDTSTVSTVVSAPVNCTSGCRPLDQIWLISTRSLGCAYERDPSQMPNLTIRQYTEDRRWESATLEQLLAAEQPDVDTCVVVHGNQVDWGTAINYGMRAYRQATRNLPPDHPVRWIIWSWPSDKERGPIRDARSKAARTPSDSIYLGQFLKKLNPQISTGALHLLGGGTLAGTTLGKYPDGHAPYGAVLVAAALDNDWLMEGHANGRALYVVDRMLLINNHCDAVLRRYHLLDRCGDNEALGLTGVAGRSPLYDRIRQVDACCNVGKTHSWEAYLNRNYYGVLMKPYMTTVNKIPVNQITAK